MAINQTELEGQLATDVATQTAQSLELARADALARAQARSDALQAAERRAKNLNKPGGEFGHGISVGIANSVGAPVDAVNAILSAAGFSTTTPPGGGDNIMDLLVELGMTPDDLPDEAKGVAGRTGESMAAAAVMTPAMLAPFMEAASDPNFEMRQALAMGQHQAVPRSRAARVAFVLKQLGESAARTAVENPKMFVAGEAAGSAAAGALVGLAEEGGLGPVGQGTAGMVGGTLGAFTTAGIPRGLTSMYRWGMRNLLPGSEIGGMQRAARQTQARTGNIPRAIARLDEGVPEGVTPARQTGDPRLMAQEARILADNPSLDLQVREDLERAVRRSQNDLRDLYDQPRGKEDWEFSIFNRVAPEGATITPGTTEDMLDQAYKAFEPLYDQVKGFPMRLRLMTRGRRTTLGTMFANVPETRTVMASDESRRTVGNWLEGQMNGLARRSRRHRNMDMVQSDDLLQLRSNIRSEQRKASRQAANNAAAGERSELLQVAESRVNQLLNEQLPTAALATLKRADDQYRNYKVVENAVFGGRDQGLTPDSLLQSLRRSSSSQGAYARGEQLELRSMAQAGRPITTIMNSPDRTRQTVRNMSAEDLTDMQNQFVDEIVRRSILPGLAEDGTEILSGARLTNQLSKFRRTAAALEMDPDTMGRMDEIASRLRTMERSTPGTVAELFADGPADILQLAVTIAGAKQGERIAGRGMGSSMILASFFATRMRRLLATMTADRATDLMEESVTNTRLYRALLTTPTDQTAEQNSAARVLAGWLATQEGAQAVGGGLSDEMNGLREEADALGIQ